VNWLESEVVLVETEAVVDDYIPRLFTSELRFLRSASVPKRGLSVSMSRDQYLVQYQHCARG
jgi:hypothetical protein